MAEPLDLGPIEAALDSGDPIHNRPWLVALLVEVKRLREQVAQRDRALEVAYRHEDGLYEIVSAMGFTGHGAGKKQAILDALWSLSARLKPTV